jgi:hypothetical protein
MQDPLLRVSYGAAKLFRDHPPRLRHANKAALLELAYPAGCEPQGTIEVTRWRADVDDDVSLPEGLKALVQPNFYDYPPAADGYLNWHVNFADPEVFVAYGSGLFAQDEMQAAEHPLLGSVREALLAAGLSARTEDEQGGSPILVRGVERRLEVRTDPDRAAGRPEGLYGNRFGRATVDVVRRAARLVKPPTTSNIIAIAAPAGGRGEYRPGQIEYILETALTAFASARAETLRTIGPDARITIHTGFWGCGAFGGNRRLMIALQSLCAQAAGINRVVFHAGDPDGAREAQRALDVADAVAGKCGPQCPLGTLIDRCVSLGYKWGVSDGN